MNQGTEGSEVDDLLQLSYLQRLARQKVAEMEVPLFLFHLPPLYGLRIEGQLSRLRSCSMIWHLPDELSGREIMKKTFGIFDMIFCGRQKAWKTTVGDNL